MKVSEAIRQRRTVRGFKKDPVPDPVLQEIFDTAQYSASNCNTQPWHLTVISGSARDKLEQSLIEEITGGKAPSPAFKPGDAELSGVYKERQYKCAADYYKTMGISREDKTGRTKLALKNWHFFGAPHVGIISMPTTMGETNALDIGIYLQSLMLLFVEYGLASCPQGALAHFPDPILELGGVPKGNSIICGISFGYEDTDALINQVRMPRAPLEDSIRYIV